MVSENPADSHFLKERPKNLREIYGSLIPHEDLVKLNLLRIDETRKLEKAAVDAKNWKNKQKVEVFGKEMLARLRTGDHTPEADANTSKMLEELKRGIADSGKKKRTKLKAKGVP